jgi:myo-inositol-1-phosphate synthase
MKNIELKEAQGKLGVLIVGVGGAVASTFIAGTLAVRKGIAKPIGSLTQLSHIKLKKDGKIVNQKLSDAIPLTKLNDIVFGGWDIFPENVYDAAVHAEVLLPKDLNGISEELKSIRPMKGVFDQNYVKRLNGTWVKSATNRWELMEQVREDIRSFKKENNCDRVVVLWAGSTEIFMTESNAHQSIESLEKAMRANDTEIAPSICYAFAALSEGVPYINGAPNLTVDFPAMAELAAKTNTPICGKDFKTGQTLLKTVLAPMFKTRMLGLEGWFSTNILGNRDGEVLDEPSNFKTKEESKLSVIESILVADDYPDLYSDIYHKVRINYYPPRKDNKESWDNIDLVGWMGYPMQMKVNFLCRDSILAAPLCLDLVLLTDLAQRSGLSGMQTWLGFYFKSPMHTAASKVPVHDIFVQYALLKNKLREIVGSEQFDIED